MTSPFVGLSPSGGVPVPDVEGRGSGPPHTTSPIWGGGDTHTLVGCSGCSLLIGAERDSLEQKRDKTEQSKNEMVEPSTTVSSREPVPSSIDAPGVRPNARRDTWRKIERGTRVFL